MNLQWSQTFSDLSVYSTTIACGILDEIQRPRFFDKHSYDKILKLVFK